MNAKVSELINYATKSPSRFEESLSGVITVISKGKTAECKAVISQIKKIIKDSSIAPPQKVLALELFQACMLLNKSEFIIEAQKKILKRFVTLAQKNAKTIFKNSGDCLENKNASEKFLNNLLNYFYIWANEFGQTPDKKPSELAKAFYKLRETVSFPAPKPRESVHQLSSSKTKIAPSKAANSHEKQLNLEYIENTLEVLEKIPDPNVDESAKELISILIKARPEFNRKLEISLSKNNYKETENLIRLNDRMLKFNLSPSIISRGKTVDFTENNVNAVGMPHNRYSVPDKIKINSFEDILELESSSQDILHECHYETSPYKSKEPEFTYNFSTEIHKKESEEKILQKSKNVSYIDSGELYAKIESLEKIIEEKDIALSNMSQNCQFFQSRMNQLETALNKTKELLLSKEKECEEYHCLKNEFRQITKDNISDISSLSNSYATTGMLLPASSVSNLSLKSHQQVKTQNEPIKDDLNFRLACCESSTLLLNTDIIELHFQGILENTIYKMKLCLINKSNHSLSNIEFEIDSAFGFNIEIIPTSNNTINPGEQFQQELLITLLSSTHITPIMVLEFSSNGHKNKYTIELPVSICKFSKLIQTSYLDLWNE